MTREVIKRAKGKTSGCDLAKYQKENQCQTENAQAFKSVNTAYAQIKNDTSDCHDANGGKVDKDSDRIADRAQSVAQALPDTCNHAPSAAVVPGFCPNTDQLYPDR